MSHHFGTIGVVSRWLRQEGLRIRLDPNNVQASTLSSFAGADRFCSNAVLARINEHQAAFSAARNAGVPREELPKPYSFRDLQVWWQEVRDEVAPWHREIPSKVFLFAIMNTTTAHRDWMAGRARYPRFKAKRRSRPRFRVADGLKLEPGRTWVPRLGWVRIAAPDARQAALRRQIRRGRSRIVAMTVSRDTCGTWWAALTVEHLHRAAEGDPKTLVPAPAAAGVDVGVKSLVVAADTSGEELVAIPGSGPLRAASRRVRARQRRVSRSDRSYGQTFEDRKPRRSPSRRRAKAQVGLARTHRRARFARETLTHQASAALVRLYRPICIEDLNVKGMTSGGGARKRGLNRAIHDAALGELHHQLSYKLQPGYLIEAPRFFPSSKRCHRCGSENQALTLADRTWTCPACGAVLGRDLNAAANLAAWGESVQKGSPIWTDPRAGDRDGDGPSGGERLHARRGRQPSKRYPNRGGASSSAGPASPGHTARTEQLVHPGPVSASEALAKGLSHSAYQR